MTSLATRTTKRKLDRRRLEPLRSVRRNQVKNQGRFSTPKKIMVRLLVLIFALLGLSSFFVNSIHEIGAHLGIPQLQAQVGVAPGQPTTVLHAEDRVTGEVAAPQFPLPTNRPVSKMAAPSSVGVSLNKPGK